VQSGVVRSEPLREFMAAGTEVLIFLVRFLEEIAE